MQTRGEEPEVVASRADSDLVLQPAHHVEFPGSQRIHSVSFSPDGRTVYCLVDGRGIDLWAAAVSVWPEALGAALIVMTAVWCVIVRRVRSRPQVSGAPHCRKCNYNVVAQASGAIGKGTLCTECGVDLSVRRPVRGRTFTRRLWAPTVIVLAAAVGYGFMHAAGLPRMGPSTLWLGWWSTWIDGLSERYQIAFLEKHRIGIHEVWRVKTSDGKLDGRLCVRRDYPSTEMLTSPDGGHVVFGGNETTLVWVSTSTGWATVRDAGGDMTMGSVGDPGIVGFDGPDADPWLYYGVADQEHGRSRLIRWRPSTDVQEVVVDEPGYGRTVIGRRLRWTSRRYALLRWPEGTATVSAPSFAESYNSKTYTLVVRSPIEKGGEILRLIENPEQHLCMSAIVTTPSGSAVYISNSHSGVLGVDPSTGDRLGVLRAWSLKQTLMDKFTLSADGRRLFVVAHGGFVLIRDTTERRWIGTLQHPQEFIAPTVKASPDGRWLASTPFKSGGPRGPYIHNLFLHDLSELNPQTQDATSAN